MGLLDPPALSPATAGKLVAPGVTLTNPRGLRRWSAALSDALLGAAVVTILGDSITVGVGSDGNSTTGGGDATYRTSGYLPQLRSLFALTYGDPGEGFIGSFTDNAGRWTVAGSGAYTASVGPYESGVRVGTAGTLTLSAPACTQIDLYMWNGSPTAQASYTIDGGGSVNLPAGVNNSASTTYTKTSITGLTNATHTLVISGPSSGITYFAGAVCLKQTTGVQVHRIARSGNTTANLVGQDAVLNGNASGQARVVAAVGAAPPSDLVIIALGVNDFTNQNVTAATNVQPGTTPTTYGANLQAVATAAISNGACVLLLGEPRQNAANYPTPMTYTESDYWAQARGVALATDHCAFLDINDLWGSNVLGQGLGFYTTNSVHPTRKGHGSVARLLHRVLTTPTGPTASAA